MKVRIYIVYIAMINIKRKLSNKVLKNSAIYVASSTINASVPFLLLPIMTSCLSPQDYGITAMFQTVLGFMLPIIGLTMDGAIGLEYYLKSMDNIGRYIGNCLFLSFCSFIICLCIASLLGEYTTNFVGFQFNWIVIALIQTILQFICTVCLTLWQVSQKPFLFALFQFGICLLNAFLSILFVYYWHKGYEGRLYANFIAVFLFSIFAFIYVYRKYKVSFSLNKKILKDAISYGVPLIPHSIGGWCLSLIDRFFLLNMVGLAAVGKYSVAFQLASVLGFLTLGVNQAFVPWLYECLANVTEKTKRRIVKYTYTVLSLIVICACLYSLCLPLLQSVFINKKFDGIEDFFYILLVGFSFQGFYYFFACYIGYRKKTKYISLITISVTCVKIPITYLSINRFGDVGAAIAYSLTFFLFFVFTAFVSNKVFPMPWTLINQRKND